MIVEVYFYERNNDGTVNQKKFVRQFDLPKNGHWYHCLTEEGSSQVKAFMNAHFYNIPKKLYCDISHEGVIYLEDDVGDFGEIIFET